MDQVGPSGAQLSARLRGQDGILDLGGDVLRDHQTGLGVGAVQYMQQEFGLAKPKPVSAMKA